jgi:hypothetical protein
MEYDLYDDEDNAVPRSVVFVLMDGTFVVRWSENRVQELETGNYRDYDSHDFGAPITDYELKQLKSAGLVVDYDLDVVWLCTMPDRQDLDWLTSWEQDRARSYYLHTTLPDSMMGAVEDLLEALSLAGSFQARIRDNCVVLWSSEGTSFRKFDEAEKARQLLVTSAPEAFANIVVAFVESPRRN